MAVGENQVAFLRNNSTSLNSKHLVLEISDVIIVVFVTYRYKQHRTDFDTIPRERPLNLPCQANGCRCIGYHYVPLMGSAAIRCTCKHSADEHAASKPYLCKKGMLFDE